MSGPFSKDDCEDILRGPFYSSPLIVITQSQGHGLPDKHRVCRNLSKGDAKAGIDSVNSFINKDDFPTRFDMASKVAEMVSFGPFRLFQSFHFPFLLPPHLIYFAFLFISPTSAAFSKDLF